MTSSLLILQEKLVDADYLYLESILKLSAAILNADKDAVADYYKRIFRSDISAEALSALGINPLTFAINATLRFDHMPPKDPAVFEHYKDVMEKYLAAA